MNLGMCNELGFVHRRTNLTKALKYYEQAAEQRFVQAMLNAGKVLESNITKKGVPDVIKQYRRAALASSVEGTRRIGAFLQNFGNAKPEEFEEIVQWSMCAVKHARDAANLK